MKTSARGIRMIQAFEGGQSPDGLFRAYQDVVGVWTIGYGSTGHHVKPGMAITKEEAEALLRRDLARFEKGVLEAVKVPLTQNQFDALVSFAYNVGLMGLRSSTLLRKLNLGDYKGAAAEFGRWVHADRKVVPGLVRRRKAEAELFLTPDNAQQTK